MTKLILSHHWSYLGFKRLFCHRATILHDSWPWCAAGLFNPGSASKRSTRSLCFQPDVEALECRLVPTTTFAAVRFKNFGDAGGQGQVYLGTNLGIGAARVQITQSSGTNWNTGTYPSYNTYLTTFVYKAIDLSFSNHPTITETITPVSDPAWTTSSITYDLNATGPLQFTNFSIFARASNGSATASSVEFTNVTLTDNVSSTSQTYSSVVVTSPNGAQVNSTTVYLTNTWTDDFTLTGTLGLSGPQPTNENAKVEIDFGVTPVPPTVNAPTTFTPTTATEAAASIYTISGSFTDPGLAGGEPYTAAINWGDGTSSPATVTGTSYSYSGSHTYALAGTYNVTVSVTDSGGETGTSSATVVTVNNVTPTVNAPSTFTPTLTMAGLAASFTINGSFTDPGAAGGEAYTAIINWGDTSTSTATVTGTNYSFSGQHTYLGGGAYNVTVQVNDSGGGQGTSAATVVMVNSTTATTTTVASSAPSSAYGQSVTFTATVDGGGVNLSGGTVQFYDGTGLLGSQTLALVGAQYQAALTTATLAAGTHSIYATWSAPAGVLRPGPGFRHRPNRFVVVGRRSQVRPGAASGNSACKIKFSVCNSGTKRGPAASNLSITSRSGAPHRKSRFGARSFAFCCPLATTRFAFKQSGYGFVG